MNLISVCYYYLHVLTFANIVVTYYSQLHYNSACDFDFMSF